MCSFSDDEWEKFRLDGKIEDRFPRVAKRPSSCLKSWRVTHILVIIEFGAVVKDLFLEIVPEGFIDRFDAGKGGDIFFQFIAKFLVGFFLSGKADEGKIRQADALLFPNCRGRGQDGVRSDLRLRQR